MRNRLRTTKSACNLPLLFEGGPYSSEAMSATPLRFNCAALILALSASSIFGQTNSANSTNLPPPILKAASTNYILTASDIVHIRIFREEDLETRARLAKDGTITFPLLGTVQI